MIKKRITLDIIIERETKNIEIKIEKRKKEKIEINILYKENNYQHQANNTIKPLEEITQKEKKYENKTKNYFWQRIFKKKQQTTNTILPTYVQSTSKKEKITRKERNTIKKNEQYQYTAILEKIVNMKNEGANYQAIQEKYTGFSNINTLKKGFQDYQHNYQNGTFKNNIKKYDNKIATEEYKNKIIKHYQQSNKTLKEIAQDLSKEYGMNISTSTISRYARKELNVKNRREAKN